MTELKKADIRREYGSRLSAVGVTEQNLTAFLKNKANAGGKLRGMLPVMTSGVEGKALCVLYDKVAVKRIIQGLWQLFTKEELAAQKKTGGRWAVLAPSGRFDVFSQVIAAMFAMPWSSKKHNLVSINSPLSKIVKSLNELAPAVLVGYPSVLEQLAAEAEGGRLTISPALVISWGELLENQTEREISGAFGCRVQDVYISAEGAFAAKCACGYFHAGGCALRVLDGGSVILTSENKAFPLAGYDTGDIGKAVQGCDCGKGGGFLLKGRRSDGFVFAGKEMLGETLIAAMDAQMDEGVERYQLRQADENTLAVHIKCAQENRIELFRKSMSAVEAALAAQGISGVRIALGSEPPTPHKRSGKYRKTMGL